MKLKNPSLLRSQALFCSRWQESSSVAALEVRNPF